MGSVANAGGQMTAASPGDTHSQMTLAAATLSPASGVSGAPNRSPLPFGRLPRGQVDRPGGRGDVCRGERRRRGQDVREERPRGREAGQRGGAHVLIPRGVVGVVRALEQGARVGAQAVGVDRGRRRLVRRVDADRVLAQRGAERRHAVAGRRADVREQLARAGRPAGDATRSRPPGRPTRTGRRAWRRRSGGRASPCRRCGSRSRSCPTSRSPRVRSSCSAPAATERPYTSSTNETA